LFEGQRRGVIQELCQLLLHWRRLLSHYYTEPWIKNRTSEHHHHTPARPIKVLNLIRWISALLAVLNWDFRLSLPHDSFLTKMSYDDCATVSECNSDEFRP
jgi:hypothetical protein